MQPNALKSRIKYFAYEAKISKNIIFSQITGMNNIYVQLINIS